MASAFPYTWQQMLNKCIRSVAMLNQFKIIALIFLLNSDALIFSKNPTSSKFSYQDAYGYLHVQGEFTAQLVA